MCAGSCRDSTAIAPARARHFLKRKKPRRSRAFFCVGRNRKSLSGCKLWLELEAQAELHNARQVRAIEHQESTASRIGARSKCLHRRATHTDRASCAARSSGICPAEGIKLRVVEGVERLPAELKRVLLAEREALEQSHVEVQASRHIQHVALCVAEG